MWSFIVTTVWLGLLAVSPIATTPTTPTTLAPTTTVPPGSCKYNGIRYKNGDVIQRDKYNCSDTTCVDGSVLYRDDECMFRTPVCYGWTEKVLGQCCPVCHDNKTTVPITTPRLSGCNYNGKRYPNGASIETDPDKCYGLYCESDQLIAWDAECAFYTPYCAGWTEKIPGQCCPLCHNVTTVTPKLPTTTLTDGCLVDGKIYANGQTVKEDPNKCFGSECSYGVVHSWKESCFYPPNVCKGGWLQIPGQCCKVCANVTALPPNTTSQPTCTIGNRRYNVGQRTNREPCYVCTCTFDGTEQCSNITCDTVLDCEVKYRPAGTCCFTCGSSQLTINLLLVLLLVLLPKWSIGV